MFDNFPYLNGLSPEIKHLITGQFGLVLTAIIGRALAHHHLVRLGHRKFWSPELLWEMPTVIFCGVVGSGLAQYLDLPLMGQHAVVAIVAWLGPRGMEALVAKWVERTKGGN